MTRKEKKLYEQMRQYQPPDVEAEKYFEMQKKAQEEIAKEKILPRLHLFERIWIQAEYLSIWFWITEGILLVAGIVLTQTADKESYITFGYVLSPLLAMIGFPAILKSFSNGVGELEQSCRYNLREIFGMRILLTGVTEAVVLVIVLEIGELKRGKHDGKCFESVCSVFVFYSDLFLDHPSCFNKGCVQYSGRCSGNAVYRVHAAENIL